MVDPAPRHPPIAAARVAASARDIMAALARTPALSPDAIASMIKTANRWQPRRSITRRKPSR